MNLHLCKCNACLLANWAIGSMDGLHQLTRRDWILKSLHLSHVLTYSIVCYQKHLMRMLLLSFYGCSYETDKEVKWQDKPELQNLIQLLKHDSRFLALSSLMPVISHWCCWWVTRTENHFLLEVNYPDSFCFSWYWSNACHSFQLFCSLCNIPRPNKYFIEKLSFCHSNYMPYRYLLINIKIIIISMLLTSLNKISLT